MPIHYGSTLTYVPRELLVRLELGDVGKETAGHLEALPWVAGLCLLEGGTKAVVLVVFERRHDRDAREGKLEEFGRILDLEDGRGQLATDDLLRQLRFLSPASARSIPTAG